MLDHECIDICRMRQRTHVTGASDYGETGVRKERRQRLGNKGRALRRAEPSSI